VDIENAVEEPDTGSEPGAAVRLPSLSPSRASDFMTCPLLYRFRVIDRIPEPPTPATARGTLVHAVLERLFDRPAGERVPAVAADMVEPEWARLCDEDDGLAGLLAGEEERIRFIADAHTALTGYFKLEDPRRLEPAEREWYVEAELPSGLRLRGYVDRLDVSPAGDIRVVDYKTGKVPLEAYEASALFQMKFYALVIWRLRGVIPRVLQLMYLSGDGEVLRYSPDEADLRATERKLDALWAAISRARETGDWRPRPSRLCDWCRHKALCPEFGGTLPPLPGQVPAVVAAEAAAALPETTPQQTLRQCRAPSPDGNLNHGRAAPGALLAVISYSSGRDHDHEGFIALSRYEPFPTPQPFMKRPVRTGLDRKIRLTT
jgi:putative RecB family exonuclease